MITKMNKTQPCYNTRELCKLLKLPRSSYYYQVKASNKSTDAVTKPIVQSIKQISIEKRVMPMAKDD